MKTVLWTQLICTSIYYISVYVIYKSHTSAIREWRMVKRTQLKLYIYIYTTTTRLKISLVRETWMRNTISNKRKQKLLRNFQMNYVNYKSALKPARRRSTTNNLLITIIHMYVYIDAMSSVPQCCALYILLLP